MTPKFVMIFKQYSMKCLYNVVQNTQLYIQKLQIVCEIYMKTEIYIVIQ